MKTSCKVKVAFILEKNHLYFHDDSPVIPVFFQLECRATPVLIRNDILSMS